MKTPAVIKFTFTVVGLAMLVGAGLLFQNSRSFLARAVTAQGTVVGFVERSSYDSSRSRRSSTWHPVVQFTGRGGESITFTSSAGSNPPRYSRGERVEVLYPADVPRDAEINEHLSLWGGATLVGGLGALFFLMGVAIIRLDVAQ